MIDRDLESRQEQEKIQADSNGSQQLENLQNLEKRAKISHKFRTAPPLLRFVNTETVAFLFNIRVEQIYEML